jgi:hypothetical protein
MSNSEEGKMKKGPFVVVRTYSAGVHVGTLVSRKGREVVLADARRVWRWRGANTLNELAEKGAAEEWTRISEPTSKIVLTEAVEIITASKAAAANLSRSRWAA